ADRGRTYRDGRSPELPIRSRDILRTHIIIGGDHEAVRHRKAVLTQPAEHECLAADAAAVGRSHVVEPDEGHGLTVESAAAIELPARRPYEVEGVMDRDTEGGAAELRQDCVLDRDDMTAAVEDRATAAALGRG